MKGIVGFVPIGLVITVILGPQRRLCHGDTLHESWPTPSMKNCSSFVYTYFERIPLDVRTTGMQDEEDDELLNGWSEYWTMAGWTPIVLGKHHVESVMNDYTSLERDLLASLDPWSRALFHRWVAMSAVGGGWYADYDVFPLPDFQPSVVDDGLPNMGRMTVHDILSPTLASGSGKEWFSTLQALLLDAQKNMSPIMDRWTFWTDSLGINNLVKEHNTKSPAPLTGKRVLIPYGPNDPVVSRNPQDCSARRFRNRWVVHVSPKVFQTANHLGPTERHPKYRWHEATKWLQGWNDICHKSINNSAAQ